MTKEIKKKARIDLDTEVVIKNNVHSSFSFSNGRDVFFSMDEYGDEEIVTFSALRSISSGRNKKILQNFYLLIQDVYSEDVTVQDVIEGLRLTSGYDKARKVLGTEKLESQDFVDFVSISTEEELVKALDNKALKTCLTEAAVELYKDGEISVGKLQAVLTKNGVEDVFDFINDLSIQVKN